MKKIKGQIFEQLIDRNSGNIFEDIEFEECTFINCALSVTENAQNRSTVKNINLKNCTVKRCSIYSAIIEEVTIDNLPKSTFLQCWGTLFKHVKIKGKVNRLMLSPLVFPGSLSSEKQRIFDNQAREYYTTVDWALDISEAEFPECDIRSVPAALIIRDPETQFIIRREKLLDGKWKQIDLSDTYWGTAIELFLGRDYEGFSEDLLLVAPKAHKNFKKYFEKLQILAKEGIAE